MANQIGAQEHRHMKPLKLTLKGFAGIRDGMGKDAISIDLALAGDASLVALVGPNGAGKTTVIENLQPFESFLSRHQLQHGGVFIL
jgi:exonuclease SbcC